MKTVAVFPYSRNFDSVLGILFDPILTVTISSGQGELEIYPLFDAGADITVLPLRYGERLGLERTGNETLEYGGVGGGNLLLTVCRVEMRIGLGKPVPVRVGWAQTNRVDLLLGRLDVFNHFTFEFNHFKREIRVKQ